MAKHQETRCASPDWSVSYTTGTGIPLGMCRINTSRTTKPFADAARRIAHSEGFWVSGRVIPKGHLDGMLIAIDDYEGLCKLHGYTVPFFRKGFWTRDQWMKRAADRGKL